MTHRTLWLSIAITFLVATAFCGIEELLYPKLTDVPMKIGAAMGRGIAICLFAGLIPLAWWATRRFNASRAEGPFMMWFALALCLASFSHANRTSQHEQRYASFTRSGKLEEAAKKEMRSFAKPQCVSSQKATAAARGITVPDAMVVSYCDCFSDAIMEEITGEEVRHYLEQRAYPASFHEKATRLSEVCRKKVNDEGS